MPANNTQHSGGLDTRITAPGMAVGVENVARKVSNAYVGIGNNRTFELEEIPNSTTDKVGSDIESPNLPEYPFWLDNIPPVSEDGVLRPNYGVFSLAESLNYLADSNSYIFYKNDIYYIKLYNVRRDENIMHKIYYTATKYLLTPKYGELGVAHKVKKGYVGVKTDFPIYEETSASVNITDSNLSELFTVTNGTYYFKWDSSSSKFIASNLGVNNSSSTTTLVAKKAINNFSVNYGYTTEKNYDKFTFKYNSTTVESVVSGTLASKAWTGNLAVGDTLSFTYSKDSSQSATGETCWFGDMTGTAITQTQVGTETKEVARLFYQKPLPKIVSWADGTDEEVTAMIQAADAGEINLADYWAVGDTRTVTLAAMSATGVGESHDSQQVDLVLMHAGEYELATPVASGRTKCSFVVGMKDCLATGGYMNETNTNDGSWEGSQRREWCNSVFRNAIPSTLRGAFKQFNTITAQTYDGAELQTSVDYFALPAEREVFGSGYGGSSGNGYSNDTEAACEAIFQFDWYKTDLNRIKNMGKTGSADFWWVRSPIYDRSSNFCLVGDDGRAGGGRASYSFGLSPFGCI